MKKVFVLLMSLLAMMAATLSAKAQEVTINLSPGWNWISYPNATAMEVGEALEGLVPMEGDMIKSQYSFSSYHNGYWLGGLTHFMPGKGYVYYSSRSELTSFVFAQPSSSFVATAAPTDITTTSAVVGGTVTIEEGNHIFARGVCWGTEPNPDIDGNHTSGDIVAGLLNDTLTELTPITIYYVRAYAVTDYGLTYGEEQSFTTLDGGNSGDHAYVDLGLPSGTLWATCNVGADAPEESGDYFAWGETTAKDIYNWSTYQYCNGSYNTLTKYCSNSSYGYNGFTDNLTTLLPNDDAVTATWGNGWRMPTKEEWQELYQNTTNTWTTQNGTNGRLFTASNGNSLFLPAAGLCQGNEFYPGGYHGYYWSSSLDEDTPDHSWYFFLDFLNSSSTGMYNSNRDGGLSVRPVFSLSQNTSFIIDVIANPAEGGEVNGGGTYQEGAECTLTATANEGYSFTNWTENGEVVSTDATYTFTVSTDRTLVANFTQNGGGGNVPTGAINGIFSVSESQQVYFSQGNLQYNKTTSVWSFMENQYDMVETDEQEVGEDYADQDVVSLFGWGTSGYNHGANAYQPWSTSTYSWDYYAYGANTNNLYDGNGKADWGYNAISNGGNAENSGWRTLTQPEWDYVFFTRSTASDIRYAKAQITGTNKGTINGVILLPDNWTASTYALNSTNGGYGVDFTTNTITAEDWTNILEANGAVFLPAAGRRYEAWVNDVGSYGDYWSASYYEDTDSFARYLLFDSVLLWADYALDRNFGASVRLVRLAE